MRKLIVSLIILLLCISCNNSPIEKNNTISNHPAENSVKQQKVKNVSHPPGINSNTKKDQLVVHGIKQEGAFKMYSTVVGQGEGFYNGNPKIEIISRDSQILKTIDVFDNTILFDNSEIKYVFNSLQGDNYFDAIYNDDQIGLKYININLFPKPEYSPELLLEISYSVENNFLLCKYTYFALEPEGFDLYGSESEVVVLDTLGNEFARVKVIGPLNNATITRDNNMLYLSTGGEINEDATHPYSCYIYDTEKEKIIFTKNGVDNDCLGCGVITNTNRGSLTTYEGLCSNKFTKDIYIFDHQTNKIFNTDQFNHINCPGGGYQIHEDHCFCFTSEGEKKIFYYKKDFNSETFLKK